MDELSDALAKLKDLRAKIEETKHRHLEVSKDADQQEDDSKKGIEKDHHTRGVLTRWFLVGFFILIISCFLFTLWYNAYAVDWIIKLKQQGLNEDANKISFLELDKVLAVIIGALGTSLGFIIGYYFKEKNR